VRVKAVVDYVLGREFETNSMRRSLKSAPVRIALAAAVLIVGCANAWAQDEDPPTRAGRLSVADGGVSLEPAGVSDWTAAGINRPLTSGDRLWTDQNSRAEVDLGAAVMRLGPLTGFAFINLDDNIAQMQLSAGTLIVRVRALQANQIYEVDTPNLAVTLVQPGEYRLEVDQTGAATWVRVTEGAAEVSAGGQTLVVNDQQAVHFSGTQALTYESVPVGGPDELDAWSGARERGLEDSSSREYVAEDLPGTQDLDDNGRWESAPEYGYVWVPTVTVVGWVPYRYGHWCWVAPWGWTWVDDTRWGYAPFHYGRWVHWNNSWAWVPGPRRARPVYAPALVGWVHGPGYGGSDAFGSNVGWFPLGPREVYEAPYRVSPGYARRVNLSNTQIINPNVITATSGGTPHRYVNNNGAAVTSVTEDVFVSGLRVGAHTLRVTPAILAGAAVAATAPAIAPVRQSVLGPSAGRGVARTPPPVANRPVLAFTVPPRAPASFERQLEAVQANGGRPLARPDLARLPASAAAPSVRLVAGGAAAPRPLPLHAPPGTPAAPTPVEPSFAERAHSLQNSQLPSSTRGSYAPAPTVAESAPAAPGAAELAPRSDRPAGVPPSAPYGSQRNPQPAQPSGESPGVAGGTLYHSQPIAPPAARAPAASASEPGSRAAPPPERLPHYRAQVAPPAAPPVPAAPHTSAPPPASSVQAPPAAPPVHGSPPPSAPQTHSAPPPARDSTSRPQ